ncbi:Flp pilus assembly protein TadG [Arcanobacterium wilhelmae]|uniref:Flp pilus assembly protein TadG n=1 Tax=Arcanobacterium wilhelmae TaxID=1803177 RepID=A0ABT9NBP3_9ACTO|nr:TadE family type IV pilus minor pilin [Arcanobacterium wilhelmae]MDP9801092.1 Flp pilus assembly protein TadG [Arcanobacterium wilhelmae]WFN90447.1 TadE family type IV pilus minor pilin [Arcanobacterium wilhelmae]
MRSWFARMETPRMSSATSVGTRGRRAPDARTESGMVTAEFAIVLPVVALVVVFLISCIVGAQGISATDTAAREVSRAISLGANESEAMAIARATAGEDAQVLIGQSGRALNVSVSAPAHGALAYFGITFTGKHHVVLEPGIRGPER